METNSQTSQVPGLLERFNNWLQESIMIKLFSIGFLLLILLIPAAWISELIYERQSRANSVMDEVADKWSGPQSLTGPVLVIPYKHKDVIDRGKDGVEIRERVEHAYFLPEQLTIDGKVSPETLHRGIFDAVVYESSLQIKSTFSKPDFTRLNIAPEEVLWKDAYMICGISDLRGISDNPSFLVGEKELTAEPSNHIGVAVNTISSPVYVDDYDQAETKTVSSTKGITAKLNWETEENFNGNVQVKLDLKGSKRLDFVPSGKTTDVKLSGTWKDPSFDGVFVPAEREITEEGFSASWKVLHFNRPFSQQWTSNEQTLSGAEFGVKLLVPVDQYQKSTRTAKYGILVILLTFVALFLVEITQKIRIHPFQYILIGAALIIYYTLLLSLSEHFGYNLAYIIASIATVALVSMYSTTFMRDTKLVALFTILLLIFYTFIFVIIVQQDFSLLIGSIGLFIIVGMLMYFSRKISWYSNAKLTG
jgi:inner membrane protein